MALIEFAVSLPQYIGLQLSYFLKRRYNSIVEEDLTYSYLQI